MEAVGSNFWTERGQRPACYTPCVRQSILACCIFILVSACSSEPVTSPNLETDLDRRVWNFLDSNGGNWDLENVPATDGRLLYDLIVENGYTNALDIGTSTGHSSTWMAWALSKTGGKLVTVEYDASRHRKALENFEKASLLHIIDARLADAHELVPALEGPFDFVFCDADKDWYINYLNAVMPKLQGGGCFAAHNVRSWLIAPEGFLEYVDSLGMFETTIEGSPSGVSVSYKRSALRP
jgi:caffeoyl-CoA O-methyltransferase